MHAGLARQPRPGPSPAILSDPARGIGQALRAAYCPVKGDMPDDLRRLLEKLA